MNVFLVGATGVLGRRIVEQLSARGHSVLGLVRSREGEQMVARLGGQPCWADLFETDALVHAARGAEVVIHAATAIPTKTRTSPRDWALNDRIRREGTESLANCAGQIGARMLIQQSIAWLAAPPDGASYDESSLPHPDALTQSALDGERIAEQTAAKHGYNTCVLRCAWFYSAEAAHTRMLGRKLKRRRMPIIGKGDTVWSQVHVDDAAAGFVAAAEAGKAGLWHLVDNEPVTMREFLTTFAAKLGAAAPRSVPIWLARLLAGKNTVDFFTQSSHATSARFRQDFNWKPRYPTYREGLDQIVTAWGGSVPA